MVGQQKHRDRAQDGRIRLPFAIRCFRAQALNLPLYSPLGATADNAGP
jgi:hypothetical protein